MAVTLAAEDHVAALLGKRAVAETAGKVQQPVGHWKVPLEEVLMDH